MWRAPDASHTTSLPLLPRLTRGQASSDSHALGGERVAPSAGGAGQPDSFVDAHSTYSVLSDRLLRIEQVVNGQREDFLRVEESYRAHLLSHEARIEGLTTQLHKKVQKLTTDAATEFLKESQEQRFKQWTRTEVEDLRTDVGQTKAAVLSIPHSMDKLSMTMKNIEVQVADLDRRLLQVKQAATDVTPTLVSPTMSPEPEPMPAPTNTTEDYGPQVNALDFKLRELDGALREHAHRLKILEIPKPTFAPCRKRRRHVEEVRRDDAGDEYAEDEDKDADVSVEVIRLRHLIDTQTSALKEYKAYSDLRTDRLISEAVQQTRKEMVDLWRKQQAMQQDIQNCVKQLNATMTHATKVSYMAHSEATGRVMDRCTSVTISANQLAHTQHNKLATVQDDIKNNRNMVAGEIRRVEGGVLSVGRALADSTQKWDKNLMEVQRSLQAKVLDAETLSREAKKNCSKDLAEMVKQFTNRLDDMTTRQNEVSEKFTALELHTTHNVKSCINDIREREKRLAEKNTTRDSQWARQLEKTDFDLRADVFARLDENHAGMTKELATMETNNQTYRSNTDKQLDLMENTLKDALKDVVAHLEARIAKDKETIMESVHEQGSLLRTQATDMDGRIMRVRDDFGQRLEVFQQHMLRKIDEYLRDTNHAFDKVRVAVQEITSSVGQIESDFATKLTTDLTTQHVEHKALLEHCETRMRDTTELLVREEKRARLEHDTMRTRSLQQRLYAFEEKVKAETQAHLQYTIERLDAAMDDWDSRDVLSRQSLNIWKALLDTRLRDMRKQTDAGFEKAREFTAHVNESVRLGDARLTEELARHRKKSERDIAACADQQQNDMAVVTGRVEAGMLSLGGAISALESGLRDNALWTKRTFEETKVITNALKNAANEHKEAWEDSCKAYDAQLGSLMDKLETTVDTARSDIKANNERMDTNLTALRDQLDGQKEDAKEEMNGMKKQMKEDSENSTQMRGALKEKVREQINGADTRIGSFEETERKNTARLGSLEDAKPDYEIRMGSLKNRETTYGEDAKKGTQAEKAGSSKEGEESDEVSEESKQNAVDEEKAESEQETSEQRKKNAVDEEKAKRKEEASEQSKKRAVDNEKAGSEEEASEQGKASLANDEKAESDEQASEKRKKNAPEYEKAENEKAASEQSEKKPWEDEKADGTEETYEHGKTSAADSEKAESVEGPKQGKDDVCKEEVTAQVST